ncbi:MAG: DUF2490 domain-containing protein [Chitinophagales bacterium]
MIKKINVLIFSLFFNVIVFGQNIQSWNTLNIKGKISSKWTIAMEPEVRYSDKQEYFHLDVGLVYKINKKLKIGGYYREIFEIKSEGRVHEVRPHIDVFYKPVKSFSVRVRNEYQIKEFSDNIWRIRVRPTYSYAINDWFIPFVQTEPFFSLKGFIRNRFNIGPGFVFGKLWLKPGYMLQTDIKTDGIKQTHIVWINTGLKF